MTNEQATDEDHSRISNERSHLLGNGSRDTAQTSAGSGSEAWLGLSKHLYIPVIIFMLGTAADYYDGSIFSAGFRYIGALYRNQEYAASLTIVYATVFAVAQPLYSVASARYHWTSLLYLAYGVFALGELACSFSGPAHNQQGDASKDPAFSDLVPLLMSRALTAAGSCAMVYVPNLVLNAAVSTEDRALWGAIQASAGLGGQLIGTAISGTVIGSTEESNNEHFRKRQTASLEPRSSIKLDLRIPTTSETQSNDSETEQISRPVRISTAISVAMMLLSMTGFCISLQMATQYLLQEEGLSGRQLVLAVLIPLGVSGLFLTILYKNERYLNKDEETRTEALFPWTLISGSRKRLSLILLAAFIESAIISIVLFILPWYSQTASTSKVASTFNTWLFWSMQIGEFCGHISAGLALKRWRSRSDPLLRPKRAVSIGTAAFISAAFCTAINWTFFQNEWICYISDLGFGFANGVIPAALLPCVLEELGQQRKRHQAIVYAGLHLVQNVAFQLVTALSNVILQGFAQHYMNTAELPGKEITHCLADLGGCLHHLDKSDPPAAEAVRQAFLHTSSWFAAGTLLISLAALAPVASSLEDYILHKTLTEEDDSGLEN